MTEPNLRFLAAIDPDHRKQFLACIDRLILVAYRRAYRIEDPELTVREVLENVQLMSAEDTDLGRHYRKWAREALNPTFKSLKKIIETIAVTDNADLLKEALRAARDFKQQFHTVRHTFPSRNFFSVSLSKRDNELSSLLAQSNKSHADLNDHRSAIAFLECMTNEKIRVGRLPDLIYYGFLIGNAFETGRFGSGTNHNATLAACVYKTAGWAAQRAGNSTWTDVSIERMAKLEAICDDPAIAILRLLLCSHSENVFDFDSRNNSFAIDAHAIAKSGRPSLLEDNLLDSGIIYANAADESAIRGAPLKHKVAQANDLTVGDLFEIGCEKSDKENDPSNWIGIRLRYAYRLALEDDEKQALCILREAEGEARCRGTESFEMSLNLVKGALLRKQSPVDAHLHYKAASEAALVAGDLYRARRMLLKEKQDLGAIDKMS